MYCRTDEREDQSYLRKSTYCITKAWLILEPIDGVLPAGELVRLLICGRISTSINKKSRERHGLVLVTTEVACW